jgi:hypothetical protein
LTRNENPGFHPHSQTEGIEIFKNTLYYHSSKNLFQKVPQSKFVEKILAFLLRSLYPIVFIMIHNPINWATTRLLLIRDQ